MYIIKDPFNNDHSSQIKFIRCFEGEYQTNLYSRRSKMKGNNNLGVILCVDMIMDRLKRKNPEKSETLRGLFTSDTYDGMNSNNYNRISFEEKVMVVRKINDTIYKFLEELSR